MRTNPEVIEYMDQFPPDTREILYRIRELISDVVPDVEESIKWAMPTYAYNKKLISYIAGYKKHVTLAFYDGTMLNDPEGKLGGSGKFMRHIKFRSAADIDDEQIRIWILEGFYS